MSASRSSGDGRRALITGISGQDGSYLAELLLDAGYEVHGMAHGDRAEEQGDRAEAHGDRAEEQGDRAEAQSDRTETQSDRAEAHGDRTKAHGDRTEAHGLAQGQEGDALGCSEHLRGQVQTIVGDLLDHARLAAAVETSKPDELYHLAAPSFVPDSWQRPARTFAAIAGATAALLEAVRDCSLHTRVFVASSAAMFGEVAESPQRETTSCSPQSPYAVAKLAAHQLAGQLRAHDGVFVCCGILYNHESERRPERFVTRRISKAAAEIKLGLAERVMLGDLDTVRDWSFAGDVVRGAWLCLQQEQPDDYVLASGEPHTVAQLAQAAFAHVGLDWREHVEIDRTLKRAPERTPLVGDPSRARERLGWRPTLSFEQMVGRMVDADLQALRALEPHE